MDLAGYLFKLNVTNYPESPNVYNSLGDFYEANGDNKNAIANYEKYWFWIKTFRKQKEN